MSDDLNQCVWMWAGLLTYRLCNRGYRCSGCPAEALFRPDATSAPGTAPESSRAHGSVLDQRVPAGGDRFHDPQHLWLRVLPAGAAQIGLDPVAASLLRPARGLDLLPDPGASLRAGQVIARAHFPDGTIEFASPVDGDVVRVHRPAAGRRASMLRHPYTRAWIMVMSVPRLEQQLARLSFGRAAGLGNVREWSGIQEECLGLVAGSPAGRPVLPDGGELDLERLAVRAKAGYPALVRRWIGAERTGAGRSSLLTPRKRRGSQAG